MERHSFAMEIKKGKKNDYRQILGEIWPDLTAFLDQEKVHNFSIWNCESLILRNRRKQRIFRREKSQHPGSHFQN
mgnify:CR=1 FL=1